MVLHIFWTSITDYGWLVEVELVEVDPMKKEVLYLSHWSLRSGTQLPSLEGTPLVLKPRVRGVGVI